MRLDEIYALRSDQDIILPRALAESFVAFVSASGMPFEPVVSYDGENAVVHFLFLSKPLAEIAQEFIAVFEPDGFYTTEMAVPNDRIKHTERVAEESGWLSFIRQSGAERSRICFIRTPRSVSPDELEERVELVT